MSDDEDVVIVDASGTEHRFPSGFDPKKAGGIVRYRTQAHPPSAEDFMRPEDIANRDNGTSIAGDIARGFGKRAASSVAGIGEMAAASGMIPGVRSDPFNPVMRHPYFTRAEELTAPTNDAQRLGGRMELAAELAGPAISLVKAAPTLARGAVSAVKAIPSAVKVGGPVLVDVATGNYVRAARRLLGAALDKGVKFADEAPKVLAEAGAEAPFYTNMSATVPERIPATGDFSLPIAPPKPPPVASRAPAVTATTAEPPATISGPGAGFSMPAGRPAPPVAPPPGRIVPAPLSTEDEMAGALAEVRTAPAMPRVTTPPPAELPAGYTPRTTAPKPRATPAAKPVAPPTEQPARRAYFLKSPEAIAAERAPVEVVTPSGSITIDDLPEAWKARTGQDLFPTTGAEAKEITAAFRAEIKERGMTMGQAIAAVSKNRDIPTRMRTQIIRSLSGGK